MFFVHSMYGKFLFFICQTVVNQMHQQKSNFLCHKQSFSARPEILSNKSCAFFTQTSFFEVMLADINLVFLPSCPLLLECASIFLPVMLLYLENIAWLMQHISLPHLFQPVSILELISIFQTQEFILDHKQTNMIQRVPQPSILILTLIYQFIRLCKLYTPSTTSLSVLDHLFQQGQKDPSSAVDTSQGDRSLFFLLSQLQAVSIYASVINDNYPFYLHNR